MAVIVTRPDPEGSRWVRRLCDAGVDARFLPLIEISPAPGAPVRAAWDRIAELRAVMFVSGNAVRYFFSQAQGRAFASRAWAPGPGTREALLDAGVQADRIDSPAQDAAQFDSEALWSRVAPQVHGGDRVLLVGGSDGAGEVAGRDWLAAQVAARGAAVENVVAYVRERPSWDDAQTKMAHAALQDGSTWLISSSESVANLLALVPGGKLARANAVVTHPRIAQAARRAGFGDVRECRPAFAEVLACLQSA